MSRPFEPVIFRGDVCTLLPLSYDHHDDLVEAVKDGELWRLWYTFVPEPHNVRDNINTRLNMQADGI